MRSALAVTVMLVALAAPPVAGGQPTADGLLRDLASQHRHSWRDHTLTYDQMVARYHAGRELAVACGYISEVARRVLVSHGYRARLVAVVTRQQLNQYSDGHTMIEVHRGGRWILYDLDRDLKAVNRRGRGVGLVEHVRRLRAGSGRWKRIAPDRGFSLEGLDRHIDYEALGLDRREVRHGMRRMLGNPGLFDHRVFGVPLIAGDREGAGAWWAFGDQRQRERLEVIAPNWRLVSPRQWQMLVGSSSGIRPADSV